MIELGVELMLGDPGMRDFMNLIVGCFGFWHTIGRLSF